MCGGRLRAGLDRDRLAVLKARDRSDAVTRWVEGARQEADQLAERLRDATEAELEQSRKDALHTFHCVRVALAGAENSIRSVGP